MGGRALTMCSIALLIVHPERIVRESLSTVLAQREELTVLGTSDGRDSMALIESMRARRADILILDIAIAQRYGPQVMSELRFAAPDTRMLVTGVPDRDADIMAMIECGATGYATQGSSLKDLISNIQALMFGQTLCSPRIASTLFSRIASQARALTSLRPVRDERQLTRRELQIIALIDAGLTNKEIAQQLSLEVQTVKNHVHNILYKLQVRRRIDAARYAGAHGLLSRMSVQMGQRGGPAERAPAGDQRQPPAGSGP